MKLRPKTRRVMLRLRQSKMRYFRCSWCIRHLLLLWEWVFTHVVRTVLLFERFYLFYIQFIGLFPFYVWYILFHLTRHSTVLNMFLRLFNYNDGYYRMSKVYFMLYKRAVMVTLLYGVYDNLYEQIFTIDLIYLGKWRDRRKLCGKSSRISGCYTWSSIFSFRIDEGCTSWEWDYGPR